VRAGWRALVVSSGGALLHELRRGGVTHVTLPVDSKNPIVMLRNVGRLSELIKEHNVSVVHARSRAPAWSAEIAAKRCRRPFVTTFHGTYDTGTPFKYWYGKVMTRGEKTIAISDFIADYIHKTFRTDPDRVVTIPRGIDPERFNPENVSPQRMIQLASAWRLPDGAPVVMLPGRLTRWKGQLVLIEALARLERDDISCLLVGSDQGRIRYRAELERKIRNRGLAGRVRIIDDLPDMPAAYMLADIVVSASTNPEAFGRVAVEGQAMGRLVIATEHGGSRETVLPGETGWLVPPADPDALAAALMEALSVDPELRNNIGQAARAHAIGNFTVDQMCQRTLDVYRGVMRDGSVPTLP
jgi:glycosyltransferase involved in cell wall biosynthesis